MQKELNLRQKRWLKLLKDYNLTINYHPKKMNVIVESMEKTVETIEGYDLTINYQMNVVANVLNKKFSNNIANQKPIVSSEDFTQKKLAKRYYLNFLVLYQYSISF